MFCNLNLKGTWDLLQRSLHRTCFKSNPIRSDRFGFEPEIVMKSAKRNFRIYETPISYHGPYLRRG